VIATQDTRRTVGSPDAITERVDSITCVTSRDQERTAAAESRQHGPYLQVQGPQGAQLVPLDGGVVHVGRGLSADLYLDDSSISRRHAIILSRGSGRRILDDRSLNGTFVNGRCIQQADLRDSDVITLGPFELTYYEGHEDGSKPIEEV
jgi:pSer/pThr/pTyr-binding forkhead associated (FHA) protein